MTSPFAFMRGTRRVRCDIVVVVVMNLLKLNPVSEQQP